MNSRCWTCKDSKECKPYSFIESQGRIPYESYNWNSMCGPHPYPDAKGSALWDVPGWTFKGAPLALHQRIEIEQYKGPLFIAVGTKDSIWPADQTRRLEKTLTTAGLKPEVHYFEGEDHGFKPAAGNLENERIVKFLRRYLK